MSIANGSEDLWIGVKCQTNPEIAGSPRNAFRCSVTCFTTGVELLDGLGALPGYRNQPNSEYRGVRVWQ